MNFVLTQEENENIDDFKKRLNKEIKQYQEIGESFDVYVHYRYIAIRNKKP